ncbi:MAG: hypothetical protein GTN73_09435 [Candidatus Aminicenantes bacterium]|nr:hypothetical protein [Candidatus Aminicenantes bacterium]
MERRDFFKKVILTPVLTPLFLAAKKGKGGCELYLIADNPEEIFSLILEELHNYVANYGNSFSFLNSHPRENGLRRILSQRGLTYVHKPTQAGLTFSFRPLHRKNLPSFTLIKEGRIWDIRSRKFYSLWREMNKNHMLSSCLTIVSFKSRQSRLFSGKYVSVYKDGRKTEMISLEENVTRSYIARGGKITLRVNDRKSWVSESSCRHKICLSSPPVSFAGERIICVPNHFFLEIQGPSHIDTSIG